MKVISVKEPYATLIMEQKKSIETRSWKTNYRGEILIHASQSSHKMSDEMLKITKNMDFHNGNIICKAELVDCILMDESFLKKVKKNKNEYICGIYEMGRYAWILKNIEPIVPIPMKGRLNFWNYDGEIEKK